MQIPSPIRVGGILFEGFELLDFYGPVEMFGLLGEAAEITVLAEQIGAIRSSAGPAGFAHAALETCGEGFDVLLLPGGIGTREQALSAHFLSELKRLAEASRIVATVCTGSYLLAHTGLLDGRRATSNKRVFQFVQSQVPGVEWIRKARWVEDGKFFTSSGISAGIDMALAVIARLLGRDAALDVASRAEFQWHEDNSWDPFADEIHED